MWWIQRGSNESGALQLRREHVLLPDLLAQLVSQGVPAEDRGRITLMRASSTAAVIGDRSWIERAVLNLVGNALKFGPPGSAIGVTLSVTDGHAHMEVTDDGPGVPPDDRDHLFERYYRASSTSHVQGSGLGRAWPLHHPDGGGGTRRQGPPGHPPRTRRVVHHQHAAGSGVNADLSPGDTPIAVRADHL